jgi:transcriptional regulator with XRE-family HTH domain
VSFVSRQTRVSRLLKSKTARNAYVFENIKRMVPFQIRTMREERGWSQGRAGEALGKPQNVVSRLESPAYGKLTLQTLLDIAQGFDVGLLIKFVPFSRLVREYEDLSSKALSAQSVGNGVEARRLLAWASADPDVRNLELIRPQTAGMTTQAQLPGVYTHSLQGPVVSTRKRSRKRNMVTTSVPVFGASMAAPVINFPGKKAA